ncbi:MAG: ABC transporter substrate binding protein [Myxococcaceae bacterium]
MRALATLLVLLPVVAGAEELPRVVVVRSSNLAAYNTVVAGFSAEVRAQVEELTLPSSQQGIADAVETVQKRSPALVLAVGPQAATAARRMLRDVPVLFTMVPWYERYGLEGPDVTGIALTNALSVELSLLATVAPGRRRIGILHDPRYSAALVAEAAEEAQTRGVVVVPIEIDSASRLDRVLSGAKDRVDALLLIADKTLGNAELVRRLIDFAREQKLPLMGHAGSQVKEGALMSLSPSYAGIGQQAGRLANRIVHEKIDPGALAVTAPEVLDLSLNLETARRLGNTERLALQILEYAAKHGYTVRVHESGAH